jgi:putative sigma-54 modulation protein
MAIEITGRHVSVTDSIREHGRKRLEKLVAEFPRVDNIHMILDVEKYRHQAEVVVHGRRHILVEARETTDDMYASIDGVVDKVEKQLRRLVDKRQDRKPHGRPAAGPAPDQEEAPADE